MPFRLQRVLQPIYRPPVYIIRIVYKIGAIGYIAAKQGILSACVP